MSLNIIKNPDKEFVKLPNGKVVGRFCENKFIKEVCGSRHKLKYPPAWAIDAEVFDREVKPNAAEIVVIDKETGVKYHASVDTFDRLKGELDRGWGKQYFLKLNNWKVEDNGDRQLMFDWGGVDNG
jgi:hypothetical protein